MNLYEVIIEQGIHTESKYAIGKRFTDVLRQFKESEIHSIKLQAREVQLPDEIEGDE